MKQNILTIAKTAMKFFFDIDPVLTEHMVLHTAAQSLWLQRQLSSSIKDSIQQGKGSFVRLVKPQLETLNTA